MKTWEKPRLRFISTSVDKIDLIFLKMKIMGAFISDPVRLCCCGKDLITKEPLTEEDQRKCSHFHWHKFNLEIIFPFKSFYGLFLVSLFSIDNIRTLFNSFKNYTEFFEFAFEAFCTCTVVCTYKRAKKQTFKHIFCMRCFSFICEICELSFFFAMSSKLVPKFRTFF